MTYGHGDDTYRYPGITMNFSSNIFPNPHLEELEDHLRRSIHLIRNYPEPAPEHLERLLAQEYGVDKEQVMATSGATDAIYIIAQTFRDVHAFCVHHPTFSEYADACRSFGMQEQPDAPLCWVCNPNNPTGETYNGTFINQLADNHKFLIIDQSYEDYTLQPLMTPQEAVRHGNIIQIRSLTKRYAIPGLRLGFIIAPEPLIRRLKTGQRPWALNALALEAGQWLLAHHHRIIDDIPAYLNEAQRLRDELNTIPGINVRHTHTNFMLATIQPDTAARLKDHLARYHGILIRDASNFTTLTQHHFRIAAQSPFQNDALINAITKFQAKSIIPK